MRDFLCKESDHGIAGRPLTGGVGCGVRHDRVTRGGQLVVNLNGSEKNKKNNNKVT